MQLDLLRGLGATSDCAQRRDPARCTTLKDMRTSVSRGDIDERGLWEVSTAEVGSDEATPPKNGMAEVCSAEVAPIQDGRVEEDVCQVSNKVWGLFGPPSIPGELSLFEQGKLLSLAHPAVLLSGLL